MSEKLSLLAAIFININIMVGVGLFINTSLLAQMAGGAGALSYALLAILLLPLILSIAKLVNIYPAGGFYAYAIDTLGPLGGFISSWSYFTGKLASATIMIHASMLLLQQIIPALAAINIFMLDSIALSIFLGLNFLHLKTGRSVQLIFLGMKLIPILFVILSGLFLFSSDAYIQTTIDWSNIISTMPLVLFAAIGFEAVTSLSSNIQDAEKNGPRAILISYSIVMLVNILYQFFFYGSLGQHLAHTKSFLEAFPLLLNTCCAHYPILVCKIQGLFNIAIASSALGGAFGIIFSNSWNLHTLAKHNHIARAHLFLKENKYKIPFACVIAEGIICAIYLLATRGNQIPLQQVAAFACTISYSISILALLLLVVRKQSTTSLWIPVLALVNCGLFLASSINSFYQKGATSLLLYASFMLIGILMFLFTKQKNRIA